MLSAGTAARRPPGRRSRAPGALFAAAALTACVLIEAGPDARDPVSPAHEFALPRCSAGVPGAAESGTIRPIAAVGFRSSPAAALAPGDRSVAGRVLGAGAAPLEGIPLRLLPAKGGPEEWAAAADRDAAASAATAAGGSFRIEVPSGMPERFHLVVVLPGARRLLVEGLRRGVGHLEVAAPADATRASGFELEFRDALTFARRIGEALPAERELAALTGSDARTPPEVAAAPASRTEFLICTREITSTRWRAVAGPEAQPVDVVDLSSPDFSPRCLSAVALDAVTGERFHLWDLDPPALRTVGYSDIAPILRSPGIGSASIPGIPGG